MTLIDVDGHLPPEQLALAGAAAAARTIRRHGIGGSIGIDLPTIGGKAARQAVAEAVDAILPAAVRAHRGQRLRLPPDRPPAPPRQPVRARRRPRRVRGARPAPPRRARDRRDRARRPSRGHRRARAARLARPARRAGRRRGRPCAPTPTLAMSGGYAAPPLRTARCAASPPRPTTRPSAAAAARIATC